jgi:methyl-accepting chemotaxis protein
MEPKREYKRKKLNIAVKRELQMWLLLRILGVVIVSSLVAVLILYLYSRQEISATFYSAHIQLRRVSDLLFPVLAAGGVVSLLSGLALAIFLPQKIAGPVFRIQKGLGLIQAGDLTEKITLRKGDILTDLADSVNDTTADFRTRIEALKSLQEELEQLAASLEESSLKEVSARQAETLEQLKTG